MTPFPVKPRPCQHCGTAFVPMRPLQRVCGPVCAHRKVKADKAEERAKVKTRKAEDKTVKQLLAIAQFHFNAFIRARDAGQACICCGRPFEINKPGGSVDAGHWLSRGGSPQLRFDEANCHAQRKDCNRPGGAERFAFRSGVLARIGAAEVARLEGPHPIHKWTKPELREIKTKYAALTKQLKREL